MKSHTSGGIQVTEANVGNATSSENYGHNTCIDGDEKALSGDVIQAPLKEELDRYSLGAVPIEDKKTALLNVKPRDIFTIQKVP